MPSPFIKTFNISNFNLSYQWNKREVANPDTDPVLLVDPSREFFYPINLKFPNTSLSITGEILKLPLAKEKPEKKQPEKQPGPLARDVDHRRVARRQWGMAHRRKVAGDPG